jgi:Fibrobacter succinogenes major domain (Fib_succ_major).
LLILSVSCKKDDNDASSGNSTNGKTTAVFNSSVTYGSMTDQDGNFYKTVTIGTQTWMAENLRTMKYNDGTNIPLVTSGIAWNNLNTGAYCNYNNTTNSDTIATYGRLYNWYAVNTGKLAPKGWHVPTQEEWDNLMTDLGGENKAWLKLKEVGEEHWQSQDNSTNETGFTAVPSGFRRPDGKFTHLGFCCDFWSTTECDFNNAYDGIIYRRDIDHKLHGFSLRCVRD